MKLLEKIRSLPEGTRKIILWIVLIVLALGMLAWWVSRIPRRINEFRAGRFIEQLDLPKIKINAQETASTQEN